MTECSYILHLHDLKFYSEIHECNDGTHLCEHICTNTAGSYRCSCNSGYTLSNNGFSCNGRQELFCVIPYYCILWLDIDECTAGTDMCAHNCLNTLGSYTCTCRQGYSLSLNNRTCNGMLFDTPWP